MLFSLGSLESRAWNNLGAYSLLWQRDGWACNSREAKVRGENDLRQERWESNTRWCVTKPAIASAQNRSSHLVMWNDTGEAVFQNLSALDRFIRETKDRQFIYCVSVAFSCLSLVKLPCTSSPAACVFLPESFWESQGLWRYHLHSAWAWQADFPGGCLGQRCS